MIPISRSHERKKDRKEEGKTQRGTEKEDSKKEMRFEEIIVEEAKKFSTKKNYKRGTRNWKLETINATGIREHRRRCRNEQEAPGESSSSSKGGG